MTRATPVPGRIPVIGGRISDGTRAGACRCCGAQPYADYPASCTSCAYDQAVRDRDGQPLAAMPTHRLQDSAYRKTVTPANVDDLVAHLLDGRIRPGRYYVWTVGLDWIMKPWQPQAVVGDPGYSHRTWLAAELACHQVDADYQVSQTWVVTDCGIWQVS